MTALAYFFLLFAGTALFALQRFRMTIWWVAFYAGAIYGMPVAVGWDLFGYPISQVSNITVILSQSALLLTCFLKRDRGLPGADIQPSDSGRLSLVAVVVCLVSFAALVATYGTSIFFVHKTESGVSGYFYIAWRMSATYAVLISMVEKRHRLALVALVPLLATIFAGDRTAVGLAAIALLWMGLQTGRLSGLKFGIAIPTIAMLGLFLFFGKTFQALWSLDAVSSLQDFSIILQDEGTDAITTTEPFAVIGVFSALTQMRTGPPDSLILDVASQFLIVPSWFGFDSGSFNSFFQPILFPGYREKSLAYSYWGEGYVRAQWFGVAAFFAIYWAGLHVFDRLSRRRSLALRSFAFVGGSYWAFYIHRNSLVSIIAYERQIILFLLALLFLAAILRLFDRRINP